MRILISLYTGFVMLSYSNLVNGTCHAFLLSPYTRDLSRAILFLYTRDLSCFPVLIL